MAQAIQTQRHERFMAMGFLQSVRAKYWLDMPLIVRMYVDMGVPLTRVERLLIKTGMIRLPTLDDLKQPFEEWAYQEDWPWKGPAADQSQPIPKS